MEPARAEYVPNPDASRDEMEAQQREIANVATFADAGCPAPAAVEIEEPLDLDQRRSLAGTGPIVAGVDQAFLDGVAVSAVVAIQGDSVVEVACGRTELSIPYIPGLLSFREGGPIIDALDSLTVDPDLLVFDGSGRIHYRQAGLATHLGVVYDRPAIGVAKNLLCGQPAESLAEPLPEGTRVPIYADESVTAEPGTILGYASQSRQFPNPERRHVNPIYVSPGHRVSAETAVSLVAAMGAGYKLPEPIRLADRAASDCKH
ncbi:deoxyribonuclease V [Halodesulfurarchaeum formicicum]|uniref:Endonuclease V n=1 Tax=Halodesulfurarchaeum formicicum TaxID=1873524 RepID=A0A1D8S5F1_9EURY|nr:endonuclease V [Halodesulfurarchaeum formicicum]AOW80581.1 deoxyribonuclease V [Halodesulfurarchaeum formicicum]APE95920.1 deoxyribonuclease V [Halodesulfurarchaeum formicicum]